MMIAKDLLIEQLNKAHLLFENFIKDLSEEEAHFQPGGTGNHACWILMHAAVSADQAVAAINGQEHLLSKTVHQQYEGNSRCVKDDGMTLAEAWKAYTTTHSRAVETIRNLPESRYTQPNPSGSKRFPTIGSLVALLTMHPYWHFGQLTVNRALLGKPRIFGS